MEQEYRDEFDALAERMGKFLGPGAIKISGPGEAEPEDSSDVTAWALKAMQAVVEHGDAEPALLMTDEHLATLVAACDVLAGMTTVVAVNLSLSEMTIQQIEEEKPADLLELRKGHEIHTSMCKRRKTMLSLLTKQLHDLVSACKQIRQEVSERAEDANG